MAAIPKSEFERSHSIEWNRKHAFAREIFIQGEGALPLVQLSISFLIGCFEKHNFYFLLFKQPSLKLIDNCTSGSASPCIKISMSLPFCVITAGRK